MLAPRVYLMLFALALGGLSPLLPIVDAHAQAPSTRTIDGSQTATMYRQSALAKVVAVTHMQVPVSSAEAGAYVISAVNHPKTRTFGQSFGDGLSIRSDQPRVFATPQLIGVIFPVGGAERFSTYSLWFDRSSSEFVGDVAVIGERVSTGVRARVAMNGTITMDQVVPGGETLLPLTYGAEPDLDWGCLDRCLTGQGIPSWLITAIRLACELVCRAYPPGCTLCLVGVAAAIVIQATYCVYKCW